MDDKYSRPYCKNCKLIWGASSIGRILHCTKCNRPLILQSFSPWPKVIGGLVIICIGALTFFSKEIPTIWIGGFIFGGSLIFNGFQQWSKIRKLDEDKDEIKEEFLKEDNTHKIIICGICSQKIRILKGQGIVKVECQNCLREFRIMT